MTRDPAFVYVLSGIALNASKRELHKKSKNGKDTGIFKMVSISSLLREWV